MALATAPTKPGLLGGTFCGNPKRLGRGGFGDCAAGGGTWLLVLELETDVLGTAGLLARLLNSDGLPGGVGRTSLGPG